MHVIGLSHGNGNVEYSAFDEHVDIGGRTQNAAAHNTTYDDMSIWRINLNANESDQEHSMPFSISTLKIGNDDSNMDVGRIERSAAAQKKKNFGVRAWFCVCVAEPRHNGNVL